MGKKKKKKNSGKSDQKKVVTNIDVSNKDDIQKPQLDEKLEGEIASLYLQIKNLEKEIKEKFTEYIPKKIIQSTPEKSSLRLNNKDKEKLDDRQIELLSEAPHEYLPLVGELFTVSNNKKKYLEIENEEDIEQAKKCAKRLDAKLVVKQ